MKNNDSPHDNDISYDNDNQNFDIFCGDVNADGYNDLVTANYDDGSISEIERCTVTSPIKVYNRQH